MESGENKSGDSNWGWRVGVLALAGALAIVLVLSNNFFDRPALTTPPPTVSAPLEAQAPPPPAIDAQEVRVVNTHLAGFRTCMQACAQFVSSTSASVDGLTFDGCLAACAASIAGVSR